MELDVEQGNAVLEEQQQHPPQTGLYRNPATGWLTLEIPFSGGGRKQFEVRLATVAFYRGGRTTSSACWTQFFNRLVARCSGSGDGVNTFTHAELAFKFTSVDAQHEFWLACCIYTGERLQFEAKTHKFLEEWRETLWTLVTLNLSRVQVETLLLACVQDVQRGLRFNNWLYWNFFVSCSALRYDGQLEQAAWCSEHICARLQALHLPGLETVQACHTSPQHLYDLIIRLGISTPCLLSYERAMRIAQRMTKLHAVWT